MKLNEMIHRNVWIAGLAALSILAPAGVLRAQSWQTVLDFQPASGKAAYGYAIAADPFRHVFTAGDAYDVSGILHGIALTSDTTLATWSLSDDTNPDPAHYTSQIYGCGYDSSGKLFSVGQLTPDGTNASWYVRASSDGGLNWSSVDQYQSSPGQWAWPTGFAADGSGNIYVVGADHVLITIGSGKKANTQTVLRRIVRKSGDGGQSWTLTDAMTNTPAASGATVVPGVGVFVIGQYFYPGPWLVRKSVIGDAGTWTTVDGPITNATAHGVCGDNQGNIYVVGQQFIPTGTVKGQTTGYVAWVARMSTDGGNTWSTIDTYTLYTPAQNQNAPGAWAHGAAIDSTGNVVVVGKSVDAMGRTHWIVRRRDSSTGLWTTLDDFLPTNGSATAFSVVTDAAGHLLVTGEADWGDGTGTHWIARQL
jgi:hypothetical protein